MCSSDLKVNEEAMRHFQALVQIDTSDPPGNETRAVDYLKQVLDAEGIPYETYDPGDGRTSLVARLAGTGERGKALILLSHTDVVPFERDQWTVDPLGGEVRDGYVWGRGALDMKSQGIMQLITFLLHHRMRLPLARDLVFMAVADEEAGVFGGALWGHLGDQQSRLDRASSALALGQGHGQ